MQGQPHATLRKDCARLADRHLDRVLHLVTGQHQRVDDATGNNDRTAMIEDLLYQSLSRFSSEERIDDEDKLIRYAQAELKDDILPWKAIRLFEALTEGLAEDEAAINEIVALLNGGQHQEAGQRIIARLISYWTDFAIRKSAREIRTEELAAAEDALIHRFADSRYAATAGV